MRYCPLRIGGRRARLLDQRRARGFDGDARQHGARGVLDRAAKGHLSPGGAREIAATTSSNSIRIVVRIDSS